MSDDKTTCAHGKDVCLTHPSPDAMGRTNCPVCGCFSANPDGHLWCTDRQAWYDLGARQR